MSMTFKKKVGSNSTVWLNFGKRGVSWLTRVGAITIGSRGYVGVDIDKMAKELKKIDTKKKGKPEKIDIVDIEEGRYKIWEKS